MPVDPDPRAHVSSTEDFYGMLSLAVDFAPDELRRAFRRISIRYHPDKTIKPGFTEAQKERARDDWDRLEVASKVLGDDDLRRQYDQAREARERRRQRDAKDGAVRREMIERLERTEQKSADIFGNGVGGVRKRAAHTEEDLEREEKERIKAQVQRLREDRIRRREELEKAERDEEEEKTRKDEGEENGGLGRGESVRMPWATSTDTSASTQTPVPTREVPSEHRILRVRFPEALASQIDSSKLEALFSSYGTVESAVIGAVKRERLHKGDAKKQMLGRGLVQFADRVSAVKALEAWRATTEAAEGPVTSGAEEWSKDLHLALLKPDLPGDSTATEPPSKGTAPKRQVPSFASFKAKAGSEAGSQGFQESVFARMRQTGAAVKK